MKLAVVCDLLEENWPSMDLAAETLAAAVKIMAADSVDVTMLRPPFKRRFTKGAGNGSGLPFNADRLLNRYWDYPHWLRQQKTDFSFFHLADHSYAQLIHELPAERTVVTCHDLDTFRCLLNPENESRSFIFRRLVRRTLSGLQKARRVICDSQAIKTELLATGWVKPDKVCVVQLPVHAVFFQSPSPEATQTAEKLLSSPEPKAINLLHVGSTIARKRIDVLLRVVAEVRRTWPQVRLVRVGGALTAEQQALAESLGIAEAVLTLPSLSREVLVAVYRRAALVLLPSEREGFGWPVVESLASGVPVIASDLPVLREVGGAAAEYAPVGEVAAWTQMIDNLLREREAREASWAARQSQALDHAAQYSWAAYGQNLLSIYRDLIKL